MSNVNSKPVPAWQTAFKVWFQTTPWILLSVGASYIGLGLAWAIFCALTDLFPPLLIAGFFLVSAAITLGSLWMAWSPGPLHLRTTVGVLYFASIYLSFWGALELQKIPGLVSTQLSYNHSDNEIDVFIETLYWIPYFAVLTYLPLQLMRTARGWRVEYRYQLGQSQFSHRMTIRDIMTATFLVAIVLAMLRQPLSEFRFEHGIAGAVIFLISYGVLNTAGYVLLRKVQPKETRGMGCLTTIVAAVSVSILLPLCYGLITYSVFGDRYYRQGEIGFMIFTGLIFYSILFGMIIITIAHCRRRGFELRTWKDDALAKGIRYVQQVQIAESELNATGVQFLPPNTTANEITYLDQLPSEKPEKS